MNELTITLTGQAAQDYLTVRESFNSLKDEIKELTTQLEEAQANLDYKQLISDDESTTPKQRYAADALDKRYGQSMEFIWDDPTLQENTDTLEKDTVVSDIVEPNPVTFPATIQSKPKSGTQWTDEELDVIKRAVEFKYTLAFLKVKLSNRSEAAIRSMLLNYNIGVKNNKLYRK